MYVCAYEPYFIITVEDHPGDGPCVSRGILRVSVLTSFKTESPGFGPTCAHLRFESGGEIGRTGEKEEMSDGL